MTDRDDIEDGIGDDGALAAEYALGLLEGDDLRAAHARSLTDPDFAREVAFWQERLAAFADDVEAVEPSAAAKAALMARLFGTDARAPRLRLWQGLAALASAAAVAIAVIAFTPSVQTPPALFVSELASDDQTLRVLAVIDATAHAVRLTRTAGAPAPGRALVLWGLPEDGTGPVSIGLNPATETAEFTVPDALLGKAVGLTLAISDEPEGGSPTGQPTGAILAAGPVSRL
ncbi:MAG: anti-sigma factor [Roseovarius confluentis]